MALILPPARLHGLFPPTAYKIETPKILQHRNRSATEHFDTLFGKGTIPVREITECALGAVGKTQRHEDVIATVAARIAHRPRFDLHDRRSRKKHQQVNEMAGLAEDAPSALLAVVHPMVGSNKSGVDAIVKRERFGDRRQECLHASGHRREAAVEADHQRRTYGMRDSEVGAHDLS